MAAAKHIEILRNNVAEWNRRRRISPHAFSDLYRANLPQAELRGANLHATNLNEADLFASDLREADLTNASLYRVNLFEANLSGANLSGSSPIGASFYGANLRGADLSRADLTGANLTRADLAGANLQNASLIEASLVRAKLQGADLRGCNVYGVSAWDVDSEGARQTELIITPPREPRVTVDELEVAQFLYLLLNNQKIRGVIDTITAKVVLILGRFTEERKAVLNALRQEIRARGLSPILFDFDIPRDRDTTEMVTLLARMARFVIADLSDPRSIPQEIQAIAPDVAVPIQPLIRAKQEPFRMFRDFRRKYHWVLEPYEYTSEEDLVLSVGEMMAPAEAKRKELSDD